MVPAYDEPLLWDGHASIIEESAKQIPQGVKPDAVVCCIGGGGLLAGIIVGCKNVGWDDGTFPLPSQHHILLTPVRSPNNRNGNTRLQHLLPINIS